MTQENNQPPEQKPLAEQMEPKAHVSLQNLVEKALQYNSAGKPDMVAIVLQNLLRNVSEPQPVYVQQDQPSTNSLGGGISIEHTVTERTTVTKNQPSGVRDVPDHLRHQVPVSVSVPGPVVNL